MMRDKGEKTLEDYINQFKRDERDRVVKLVREMMGEANARAGMHFTKSATDEDLQDQYDNLSDTCQHEWEGIMWGWQDAIQAVVKKIEELNEKNK